MKIRSPKRFAKIIIAGLIVIFLGLIIIYNAIDSFSHEQWALYNSGQNIKGTTGQSGIDIDIKAAWKITKGNPEIEIAVVDTGVDLACTGLKPALKLFGDKGWDFYYNDGTVYDDYLQDYHGTYIANTIANSGKTDDIFGVAPNISILPVKFMRGSSGNSEDAVAAIEYACSMGAKIINCSWMFSKSNDELYNTIAKHPDVLFVCAAGNTNSNLNDTEIFPACYDLNNVLAVTAVDNNGNLNSSSGWGMAVDIAAPGTDIISVMPEDDVAYISGTSVATAFVSGIAGLMLSANVELTPAETIEIIKKTAKKIDALDGKCESGGIIDAYECVKMAADS